VAHWSARDTGLRPADAATKAEAAPKKGLFGTIGESLKGLRDRLLKPAEAAEATPAEAAPAETE